MATALGGASLIAALCGCATHPLPEYHPGAAASTARIGREAGIEVALDPFVEPQRTRQFFGIDAVAEGIGIVLARISNTTSSQTFLVEKRDFQLVIARASSGQVADDKTIERGRAGGEAMAMVGVGALMGIFGQSRVSHATEVQRNFVGKEMPDQTLAPGQSMEGFIYYRPVPKDAGWPHGATMKINLTETKTQRPVSMTIPLSQ